MKNKNVWKHLRVLEKTHNRVKGLAGFKGMNIDEVVNHLLDLQNNQGVKNVTDYRKHSR